MAGTLGGGKKAGMITGINVTPLVDVVLVLLIILMVSSTYIVARTLKVELPKAASSDGAAEKPKTLVLQKNGGLLWNDQAVTEAEAIAHIKAAVTEDADMNLVVSADKEVSHGSVVHALDFAKVAGVTKFAINVQGE